MNRVSAFRRSSARWLVSLVWLFAACSPAPEEPAGTGPPFMSPESADLMLAATRALQAHDFVAAFALVDSVESRQPGLADVPFMRGRIYSELARFPEADSLYHRALELRPDYPGAWHNLGNTAFRRQEYSKAIEEYRQELILHPAPDPWRSIGQAHVELGATDSARAAFERAIALDSTFAPAQFSLALLLEDLGELDGALAAVREALRHEPENAEYLYFEGAYLVRLGRASEALLPLARVIDERPWHQGANYNMGQALQRTGRLEEARAFSERAEHLRELQAQISHQENTVRVQPGNAHASAALGTLLRQAGRYNDAVHAYQVALFVEPGNVEYRNNLAVLHLLRADTLAALRTLEQIVRVDTSGIPGWVNLGTVYAMSGETEKARAAFETVLRFEPGNEMAEQSLARLASRRR